MDIAFTTSVREAQEKKGSRPSYARFDGSEGNNRFTETERIFVSERDSFYMASVSESGWPYLQHRGGPRGFVKILDETTFGIADFRGNRQYVSTGNLKADDRVALFFMDYPSRRRLKLFAHAEFRDNAPELVDENYRARIDQYLIFRLEAFDWNCPQHITPRYTIAELELLEQ
jgi:predicted pyridoxine 5'-phosphate oxidase superfamily flavin-nucleotide-binding protein